MLCNGLINNPMSTQTAAWIPMTCFISLSVWDKKPFSSLKLHNSPKMCSNECFWSSRLSKNHEKLLIPPVHETQVNHHVTLYIVTSLIWIVGAVTQPCQPATCLKENHESKNNASMTTFGRCNSFESCKGGKTFKFKIAFEKFKCKWFIFRGLYRTWLRCISGII